MKLDKAIEILCLRLLVNATADMNDYKDAIKLGIEALKMIAQLRIDCDDDWAYELPGETPEGESP